MINHIKFCKIMIDKYCKKYPQLDVEIIADIIDVVLNRAPESYFTYDDVQQNPEFCIKCGKCCEKLGCSYFKGKLCDNYESRYDACKEFPFYTINFDSGIMLDCNCNFSLKLAEMALDNKFKKNIELFEI